MKDLDEAIREKRVTLMRLQEELATLERARALLAGSAAANTDRIVVRRGKRIRLRVHPMKGRVKPNSGVGQATAVLRENLEPLHIDEIVGRVNKRGVVRVKKQSLGSTIAKMSKEGKTFVRAPQPNTFGLLEWKGASGATTLTEAAG